MKTEKIFLILSLLFLVGCENKHNAKNSLSESNLIGKVNLIDSEEYSIVYKFGEVQKDSLISKSKKKYDEKGNLIVDLIYNPDGSFESEYTFKYDEKGNKIEGKIFNAGLEGKITLKYDEKGNKMEEIIHNHVGSLVLRVTFKYDEEGYDIEEKWYNLDGSLYNKYTFKYDEKGNKIEENVYNPDYILESKWNYNYEFDYTGNWLKCITTCNNKIVQIEERKIIYY